MVGKDVFMIKTQNTQKIELTQKQLDKKIGDARMEGYNIGLKHCMFPGNRETAARYSALYEALIALLDERYEPFHEDY